jgi:hypothetical protein
MRYNISEDRAFTSSRPTRAVVPRLLHLLSNTAIPPGFEEFLTAKKKKSNKFLY